MNLIIDPSFHMWFAMLLTVIAVLLFTRDDVPLEVTSIGLLTSLLVFGQLFPLPDVNGHNQLDAGTLLSGFSNPSLIAVLALLVMGQAMIHTNSLRAVTGVFAKADKKSAWLSILGIMVFVMVVSAFLNNTPLVIIAIPVLQILATSVKLPVSKVMMPLSFVAILGGMTTLIGSSTNLLVSSAMEELGYEKLNFFDFVVPGSMLAGVGFLYVLFILPKMLPERGGMSEDLSQNEKEFVAELDIAEDSKLIGMECEEGRFPELGDLNIRLIQRGGHLILPPFEGYVIQSGDILIVSATRKTLVALLSKYPGFMLSEEKSRNAAERKSAVKKTVEEVDRSEVEARVLAELMITPASRMIDMSLERINFERQFGTVVLGIQRRAKVVRRRFGRIRLEAGDVLLIAGSGDAIDAMRGNPDFIVLSGSKKDIPKPAKAPLAGSIFFSAIGAAALGFVSIPVAAIAGSVFMIATGCLNIRQATRAIDRKIFLLVGSMLALGEVLQATGGARYIAEQILQLPFADTPIGMLSIFFLLVALATNLLTNNACAILFTPIAMNLAGSIPVPPDLQVDIAYLFAITVIFGANCSFASPVGYQTNLLVMGPGHYKFKDFIKAGVPLVFVLWGAYILVLKFYFNI